MGRSLRNDAYQMGIIRTVPTMAGLHSSSPGSAATGRSPANSWPTSWPTGGHTVDIAPPDIERFKRRHTPVEVMTFV
jgi:hypothetical protein